MATPPSAKQKPPRRWLMPTFGAFALAATSSLFVLIVEYKSGHFIQPQSLSIHSPPANSQPASLSQTTLQTESAQPAATTKTHRTKEYAEQVQCIVEEEMSALFSQAGPYLRDKSMPTAEKGKLLAPIMRKALQQISFRLIGVNSTHVDDLLVKDTDAFAVKLSELGDECYQVFSNPPDDGLENPLGFTIEFMTPFLSIKEQMTRIREITGREMKLDLKTTPKQ